MKTTDGELLRRYAREGSEAAFEELVRRRINLVYSAALRQVNNDLHLAEDVTQSVFTDLARKAGKLTRHSSLTAWLYTSTRFVAANVRRSGQRRAVREKEAHAMNTIHPTQEPEPDWAQIRPLLDEAMHALNDHDREAVLLHHFERCSYAEIGSRFGVSEDGTRMRVNRALEKLHDTLAKRGVTSTALALAALLTGNAVGAAPAHLAKKMARVAMTGAGGSVFFLVSKFKLALVAAVVAGVAAIIVFRRGGADASVNAVAVVPATSAAQNPPTPDAVSASSESTHMTNGAVLHLQIVTADTGKPIPMVPIDYRAGKLQKTLLSDRFGACDVIYPRGTLQLELTTGKEAFADTRLRWRRPLGEAIPTNYILRVERAVPIGGTVVDADGNPVEGAKITWRHESDLEESNLPQSCQFNSYEFEAITDRSGSWRVNRMADAIIPRLIGNAACSNYVDSDLMFVTRDKAMENQLRESSYAFKLGRTLTATGMVVDSNGTPIQGASVNIDGNNYYRHRNTKSRGNGTFSLDGCWPGIRPIAAEAPGFAVTTKEINLDEDPGPIRLVLLPAKILRVRIVDQDGKPISGVQVSHGYSNRDGGGRLLSWSPVGSALMETDQEGRTTWSNAPDTEMEFFVMTWRLKSETIVKIRPDGQEHLITLPPASN